MPGAYVWKNLGYSTGDFEKRLKRALAKGRLSLKRLDAEALEEGLLYWELWVMKGMLQRRASLFTEAQMGNLERARLLGTLIDG